MSEPTFASVAVAAPDPVSSRAADRIGDLAERAALFASRRGIELVVVFAGLALRFAMLRTYDPHAGFDADEHFAYVKWFATHWSLPDVMLSRVTYHPPLYYVIAGAYSRLVHGKIAILALPSIVFSSATFLLVWAGLERHLPGRRLARIIGLTLAAILPASVHLAGMVSAEALNGLLATAALLVAAEVLRRRDGGARAITRAALVGLLVGLEMLTKISALAIIATIGAAVAFQVLLGPGDFGPRLRRAAPWLVAVAVFAGTSGWYFARNHRLYGKAVLSGFDGPDGKGPPPVDPSYLKRRPPHFFYGWSNDVLRYPYFPSAVTPTSYFWPVVVTSTFVDYYSFGYVPPPVAKSDAMVANGYPVPRASLRMARASAAGGVVIAASTAIAWFWALIGCWRRRAAARLLLVMAPAAAIAGLLHFVVKYPYDFDGAIKGVYLQFAMTPLFALFGLAVHKMMRRPATWPLAAVQCAAVLAVAGYTIYARVFAS